ncbi:MAG: uptake hydrogenase small subunit, partial [bacterium]|nr:uptake hydrogenase small subunit [bacterium]
RGSFYSPVTNLQVPGGVETTADQVGTVLAGAAAAGVAAHAVASAVKRLRDKGEKESGDE